MRGDIFFLLVDIMLLNLLKSFVATLYLGKENLNFFVETGKVVGEPFAVCGLDGALVEFVPLGMMSNCKRLWFCAHVSKFKS